MSEPTDFIKMYNVKMLIAHLPKHIDKAAMTASLLKLSDTFINFLLKKVPAYEVIEFIKACAIAKQETQSTTAPEFLTAGINHMQARASTYDAPAGERSMAKTVAMFNTYAGTEITEEQGWHFMQILKMVRASQGEFKGDNYEDGAAYAALAGESAARDRGKT